MRRVAAFVGIDVPGEIWPELASKANFESMQAESDRLLPSIELGFRGGAKSFIYKGTNERWRTEIAEADLGLYDAAAQRLDPGLRRWLESGASSRATPKTRSRGSPRRPRPDAQAATSARSHRGRAPHRRWRRRRVERTTPGRTDRRRRR